MGLTTQPRNPAVSLPAIDAAIRAIRQEYPELRRTPFTNLLPNGTFDNATGLTLGTGWSVGSGVATKTPGVAGGLQQANTLVVGRRYLSTITMSNRTSGVLFTYFGTGTLSSAYQTNLTSSVAGTASGSSMHSFHADSGFNGTIDNGHVWEADPDDDEPWLRLPEGFRVMEGDQMHPLASVQRDADLLHAVDFTEIWRNGQAFIKPLIAPGVSTRFSIVSYKAI